MTFPHLSLREWLWRWRRFNKGSRLHVESILTAGRIMMRNNYDPDVIALWLAEEVRRA